MTLPAKTLGGRRTKWWITLATLPFYMLVTAALFWLGGSRLYLLHVYSIDSVKTDGAIVTRSASKTRYRQPTICRITYTYSTRDGGRFQSQSDVDYRTWDSLKLTDSIPIKYLPTQPSRSRVDVEFEDQVEGGSAFFVVALGVVFLAFGVWTYWYYLQKFSQEGRVSLYRSA
jgi:Protein of unknown function (DUF3592)